MTTPLGLVICVTVSLYVTGACAQSVDEFTSATAEGSASELTERMTSSLSLDKSTSAEVSAINLKYAKETQSLMETNGPELQKLMTFRKNSEAKDMELQAVLTPEQYSEYLEGKSAMQTSGKQSLREQFEAAH